MRSRAVFLAVILSHIRWCLRVLFQLPGESILIERIISAFASRFYEHNPAYCDHLPPLCSAQVWRAPR
eukprot:COSAG05_NODE_1081_length_5940_cov_4.264852_6_plen_68_part_00